MESKLKKEAGGIIVPRVKLVGPKRAIFVDLILDTGAAYTMITWDTAGALGYDPASESGRLPIVTANGQIHVPLISLRKISITDISARNIAVICHDIPEMIEASGLLGLSFLKYFRTTIDYRSLRLKIS